MKLRTSRLLAWTPIALAAVALAGCGSSSESAAGTSATAGVRGPVEECVDRWNDWAPDLPEDSITRQQLDAIIHASHNPIVLMAESSSLGAYCSVSIFINGPYGRLYVSGQIGEAFSLNDHPVNGPPAPYEGRAIVEAEISGGREIDQSTERQGPAATDAEQPQLTRPDNAVVQSRHAGAYLQGRDLGGVIMAGYWQDVTIPTGQVIRGAAPPIETWNNICEEWVRSSLQLGAVAYPLRGSKPLRFDATDPDQVSAFLAGCTDVWWATATPQSADGQTGDPDPQEQAPSPTSTGPKSEAATSAPSETPLNGAFVTPSRNIACGYRGDGQSVGEVWCYVRSSRTLAMVNESGAGRYAEVSSGVQQPPQLASLDGPVLAYGTKWRSPFYGTVKCVSQTARLTCVNLNGRVNGRYDTGFVASREETKTLAGDGTRPGG